MIRVGLIGYGNWGKILHKKLEKFCDVKFTCRSKDTYLDKLDDVDWVAIATPNNTHFNIVKDCILAGKNVFCEKPLTPTYKESFLLFEYAKTYGVKLYVDDIQNYRSYNFDISDNNLIERRKSGGGNIKDILYRLTYHDIYLLYDYIKDSEIEYIKPIDLNRKLQFEIKFSNVRVEFLYDLNSKEKKHNINGVNLLASNDVLTKMLSKALMGSYYLNNKVDYDYNKKITLFTNKIIDKINKELFKKVSVIGGGIFGCTTAWVLSKEGYDVTLYEKNNDIISQASNINQYRLHKGYHYPRSKETAISSIDGENTFLQEYGDAVVDDMVEHYYCIAKKDSLVTSKEYKEFLNKINLQYKEKKLDFIHENVVDSIVIVDELLFDPNKLRSICWDKLKKHNVNVILNTNYDIFDLDDNYVINSTYANLNQLLPIDKQRDYQFELCEKPVIKLPIQYKNKSVVIMDGPFMCIDPLGDTGYHIMGNVVHAIHSTNIGKFPKYDSKFTKLLNRGIVKNPSITNIDKFIQSAKYFFIEIEKSEHIGSMFTFRTVLPNRDKDDARPTLVETQTDNIINVFSGKIGTCVNAAKEVLNEIR